jgi:BASS family bile acid:Na+ symporter
MIMLGLGLSFTMDDFKHVIINPKPLISALGIQIFIIPAIAFVIALVSGLGPEEQVGIVLVSTCASGASSNLITHLVRGNVPLAVSMTTINSFLSLLTLPVIVSYSMVYFLGEGAKIRLPVLDTVSQIFLVAIIPVAIGVFIKNLRPAFADRMEMPLRFILPLMLFIVFTVKIFAGKEQGGSGITYEDAMRIFPWVFLLNAGAMVMGFVISRLLQLSFRDQFTIAIEVGLHNTALALLVAGTIIKSPAMEMPALVYAMFTFFSAFLFIFLIKGKRMFVDRRDESPPLS